MPPNPSPSPRLLLALALLLVGVGGIVGSGCQPEIPIPEPSTRSSVAVTLPETPNLTPRAYDRFHSDGSLTVEGLLRHRQDSLGHVVTVRGKVHRLTLCEAPPLPEDAPEDAPPPPPPRTCDPPPHAFLVDDPRVSARELLVYGTMRSPLADLEVGQVVTLEGRFDIMSRDGVFLRQAGLLFLPDRPAEPRPEAPAEP